MRAVTAKETDTVYTDLFDKGWPNSYMRVLRNSTYEQWEQAGKPAPGNRPGEHDIIIQGPGTPIERYSRNLPAQTMNGDVEPLAHYAGQSVGLVKKKQSIHEILDEIIEEAVKCIHASHRLII